MTTAIKERPILFNAAMVRAILDGRKTQTRRIVKCLGGIRRGDRWAGAANPSSGRLVYRDGGAWDDDQEFPRSKPIAVCPYGTPGDQLWVRETFRHGITNKGSALIAYRADGSAHSAWHEDEGQGDFSHLGPKIAAKGVYAPDDVKWTPSIHMPRKFSRIDLEITEVRIQRLQEISEADAAAEGVTAVISKKVHGWEPHLLEYALLWDQINGPFSWKRNPWVWAITFKRL